MEKRDKISSILSFRGKQVKIMGKSKSIINNIWRKIDTQLTITMIRNNRKIYFLNNHCNN
jgi:hypothetical protein